MPIASNSLSAGANMARFGWLGYVLALAVIFALYWFFPGSLLMLTHIAIMAILVMSLDLVTGYAGLPTLGHAAMFGMGAYSAGLFARHFSPDPLLGLMVGAGSGALIAFVSGLFLVRYQGLAFLMLTIAVTLILQSLANSLQGITGGDNGLTGYDISPLLGHFNFDMFGVTGYWYCMIAMLVCYAVLRRIMRSPFGLCCVGIRENRERMAANGTRIYPHLVRLYVIAGFVAGVAGALSAQVTQVVSLDSLGFELSAEALVMLVLGGLGTLTGAIIGTSLYSIIHHYAATANPFHWLFVIGGLLMLVVFLPKGLVQRYISRVNRSLWSLIGRRA
ncbi:MAG TPA: branched-chain amino acid ABC transporter permease [Pusillimonas sp.]|jgi:branched-chain amino acid transport system permease protein|nr:branched-chain amino acid ABC transporter permease [Pusillimonas sp.]MBC41783.1 branched-chain amino acid ABC transporter permease [Pusillimonas sp.]HBT34187.1 branched-chain amino acid ABC transporter permease [Pusillimonas sp.]HCP77776.1 branched-chain amino acid ABC transporter permease [Pusillimonas sp.]|tara:strand:+ start:187617 stop:188615 length:999 start_codon:yes stop_codon:yes gene_type:complete